MKIKTILLYFFILLNVFSLVSCSMDDDIVLLKRQIDGLTTAIEKQDEQVIKEYLSNDFSASQKFNKTQFFLFMQYHFKNNNSISVTVLDKEIILNGDYADVTADILLLGANAWLPERGQIYRVASRWKKVRGDWFMSRLRWEKSLK